MTRGTFPDRKAVGRKLSGQGIDTAGMSGYVEVYNPSSWGNDGGSFSAGKPIEKENKNNNKIKKKKTKTEHKRNQLEKRKKSHTGTCGWKSFFSLSLSWDHLLFETYCVGM